MKETKAEDQDEVQGAAFPNKIAVFYLVLF
jgi:hypothetical protein